MKKTMKKVISMILAMCMVMAMSITVFAAETVNYTITNPSTTHNYEIYQIFTGDLSGTTLSNIKAGSNYSGSDAKADAKTLADTFANDTDATDTEKLAEIEKYVDLTGTPAYTVAASSSVSVPAGYYLIKDTSAAVTGNDAKTTYLVKIVGDTTISPKSSVPSVEKKVKETNDSTGTVSGWQDAADYDIGDTIPYQLTGTLPSTYADYTAYYYEFHDTMTNLTYVAGSAMVYAYDGTNYYNISKAFNVKWDATSKKLDIYCIDLKGIKNITITKDTKIVVRYSATLDSTANIGSTGNPNEVTLEFSNNPTEASKGTPDQPTNDKPEYPDTPDSPENPDTPDTPNTPSGDHPTTPETGTTPKDVNIVFTYEGIANKVDEDGNALKGAGFTLYKYDASVEGTDKYVAVGSEVKGENLTTFTWNGIDAGQYKLVETTTPAGFNTCDPVEFKVVAAYETEAELPKLTSLSVTDLNGTTISAAALPADGKTFAVAVTSEADAATTTYAGTVATNIVNKKGAVLPTTGGMGTTIFYVLGTILVLGAGVVLVTRRRIAR